MTTQSVTIDGKVHAYGGVMTHKTVTAGFSFKERIALLFGKPVIVVSEIYFKNEVRPLVATGVATVEPLIKPKPILKSYSMTEKKEDIPQTNGEVENLVEEVQPQVEEGINAGPGDDTAEEPAVAPALTPIDGAEALQEEAQAPPVEEPVAPTFDPEAVAEAPAPTPAPKEVPRADWKDDVRIEAKELKEKMVRLRTALDENKIPTSEVSILNEQYGAMNQYYIILNTRLSR